jgi:hypothetical protein
MTDYAEQQRIVEEAVEWALQKLRQSQTPAHVLQEQEDRARRDAIRAKWKPGGIFHKRRYPHLYHD